jgi:hypothetical protein
MSFAEVFCKASTGYTGKTKTKKISYEETNQKIELRLLRSRADDNHQRSFRDPGCIDREFCVPASFGFN